VPNTPSGGDRHEGPAARRGPAPIARVTLNLPWKVWDVVGELAEQQGISKTEVLRRAVSTEKFVYDTLSEGDRLVVRKPDGTLEHVNFPYHQA